MSLRKYVTSPDARGVRQRSDRSTPSARSDSRSGIADLEREVAGVHAEEEHLFERRRASGARHARGNRQPIVGRRRTQQQAGRQRSVREIALRLSGRRVVRLIDAAAELQRHVRPRDLFVAQTPRTRSDRRPATALRRRRRRTRDRAPTRRCCPSSGRRRDASPSPAARSCRS